MTIFSDLSGQNLGKYELRAQIGAGGMGAVYRAYQADLRRSVAVKILPFALSDDPNYLQRFNREAAISASLEHAHIVPVYDYGTTGSITYVVMRLLTGGNLAERFRVRQDQQESLPSLLDIADLLKALGSALDYAHSQHVIHRDIKPTNVMFDNQGSPFLVDFGIAKLMQATSGLTEPGQAPGTPVYMAPEQWKAQEIGPATDQYAVGIMTYFMMTGHVPFQADTPYQIMHKHFYEMPTPPQAHRADLPEAVTNVVNRALEKEPRDRYPSVSSFARAFGQAIAGEQHQSTNFFVFKLPPKPDNEPTHVPSDQQPYTQQAELRRSAESGGNRLIWSGLAALAAVVVIAVALIVLLGRGDDEDGGDDNNSLAAVDENRTRTAQAETADADSRQPARTDIPTETLDARGAALATNQVEETINAERTAIFEENQAGTASVEATNNFFLTVTHIQELTETASQWTVTPFPTPTIPTALPTAVPTTIPPTDVPTVAPTEVVLADEDYPLQPQRQYMRDASLHPGCEWQGMGGNITLQNSLPGVGLIVEVRDIFGNDTPLTAFSGTNINFGPAGWEIQTADQLSLTRYTVQVFSADGLQALSPRVEVSFPQNCDENLAVVNFRQGDSPSTISIATGIPRTATPSDADYPLQLQSSFLRDAYAHPECDWQGMGGNISLQSGVPGIGLQIQVSDIFSSNPPLTATSGTKINFGPAGWEIQTGDQPSLSRYMVQVFSADGLEALSPRVEVSFPQNCNENLAVVNFRQNDSSSSGAIATGSPPTETPTDADYPLQPQNPILSDAFLHPGCNWQGFGGNITLQNGSPGFGFQVQVKGIFSDSVPLTTVSGTNANYGVAGWEIQTGDAPSVTRYTVQIFSGDGSQALSPEIEVRFPQNCAENLAMIDFVQVAPLE